MNQKPNINKSPSETWQEFIQAELKLGSRLGQLLEKSGFGGYEKKELTLYFEDENSQKAAKGQSDKLKNKLPKIFTPCNRINYEIGKVSASKPNKSSPAQISIKLKNPLQALCYAQFGDDGKGGELSQPVLAAVVTAEKTCSIIYQRLENRTEMLAHATLSVSFDWRLRVGGTRGFRELLLPVFHPVFGVPYIPAASLKGAARAWARKNGESETEISEILGMLEGKIAKAAKVEFLDAFPRAACLSVDIATPQWGWSHHQVNYNPVPHPLLSLKQPTFLLGLRATRAEHEHHVATVKKWLESALSIGIGSRVSSGYGRALGQAPNSPHKCSYEFELWTQGMYGVEPPTKQNNYQGIAEFRPTAIRGILRYWFRAMALSLYEVPEVQLLEEDLFGELSKQGDFLVSATSNDSPLKDPYRYTGRIHLEASDQKHLDLLSKLLLLAVHLGGVGRGSRRPLHLLNGMMRGCHWSISDRNSTFKMDIQQWQQFFQELRSAFAAVKSPIGSFNSSPGESRKNRRQQDTLDSNAHIWLLPSVNQIEPSKVKNWKTEGSEETVKGSALTLLYDNDQFKGETKSGGNRNVGGALEIPSFVWIKSIFPYKAQSYQVVTIFGVDHDDRLSLAKKLKKENGVLILGSIS
jgi:CRISPR-associated protein Cmr6